MRENVIAAKAEGGLTSVATLKPSQEFAASAEDVVQIARRIDQASSVVIMCGGGCPWRRRSAARPLGPAQGPANTFGQRQGHHALR